MKEGAGPSEGGSCSASFNVSLPRALRTKELLFILLQPVSFLLLLLTLPASCKQLLVSSPWSEGWGLGDSFARAVPQA